MEKIARAIRDTAPRKLVLAHLGGWKEWDAVEELLAGEEVYMDTAFLEDYISDEQLVRIIRKHGAGKILFGLPLVRAEGKYRPDRGIAAVGRGESVDLRRERKETFRIGVGVPRGTLTELETVSVRTAHKTICRRGAAENLS